MGPEPAKGPKKSLGVATGVIVALGDIGVSVSAGGGVQGLLQILTSGMESAERCCEIVLLPLNEAQRHR
jgi:hypothetical protein